MANPNAYFGAIADISRAGVRGTAIALEGGADVRFDPSDNRTERMLALLEDLQRRKMPVYIEIDPNTGFAAQVHLPKIVRVDSIREGPDGQIGITFEHSHARHTLLPGAEGVETLRVLREAGKESWLAATVNDRQQIIDIRPYTPPFELPPRLKPPPPSRWWTRCWWPWNWFRCCVSPSRAQELFDLCAATTCDPLAVPPPCIPFMYPDDGCWGRAHEMRRLMLNSFVSSKKVWIDGWLHTPTKNNPNCFVDWGWHVAPIICVRKWRWWPFVSTEMVIDPSLFTTPVTQATWKSVQGDLTATLTETPGWVFSRWSGYQSDPSYAQTNQVLANYRAQLQLRSLGPMGPPPYANCP